MLFQIDELSIIDVLDRGVPNMERIALLVNQPTDLGGYGLMIGIRGHDGAALPLRDNLLWFGNGWVVKGDWIFVYTGPGQPRSSPLPNNNEKLYSIHWGKTQTVFQNNELVPMLFRMDAIQVSTQKTLLTGGQIAGA